MRGGNRGALGCCSPETSAMLSAPRAPPEWQASLRERERPENQSHFGRKTHVYLPHYRHGGVYWVVTGKSCAAARGPSARNRQLLDRQTREYRRNQLRLDTAR